MHHRDDDPHAVLPHSTHIRRRVVALDGSGGSGYRLIGVDGGEAAPVEPG